MARLTQRQLAERLPYSYSYLNQVECGARPATAAFVAACARALHIDVTVLTGQPSRPPPRQSRADAAPGVQVVRTVARSTWRPGTTPAPRCVGRRRTGWQLGRVVGDGDAPRGLPDISPGSPARTAHRMIRGFTG
ncbi:helix-turn-helix domain-containing protein [Streptomyces capoamus]|uniref:helix-turn-helix domain-containing protein n=1 Tax=Streptomyces capoamus TaxID=68183 RepID=UPI003C30AEAB